jgi:molybdate transport system substrate-binding protein
MLCGIAAVSLLFGCSQQQGSPLTVSVASSLTVPIRKQLEAYATLPESSDITINIGSSGALAQQIINGARVDLFISANQKWIHVLQERALMIEPTDIPFLGNEIVLIQSSDSSMVSIDDLLAINDYKLAIGSPESVPIGEYAIEWLENTGLLRTVEKHMVYLKDEQQVLRAVALKHADAGFVYRSSLLQSNAVDILEVPDPESYPKVQYFAGVLKSSTRSKETQAFLNFLKGPQGKKIWRDLGFQVVD